MRCIDILLLLHYYAKYFIQTTILNEGRIKTQEYQYKFHVFFLYVVCLFVNEEKKTVI